MDLSAYEIIPSHVRNMACMAVVNLTVKRSYDMIKVVVTSVHVYYCTILDSAIKPNSSNIMNMMSKESNNEV